MVVRSLQAKVGALTDGLLGFKTVLRLQKFLNANGAKLREDGFFGPETAKAFQRFLNKVIFG